MPQATETEIGVEAVPSGQEPATRDQIEEDESFARTPENDPQNIENVQIVGVDSSSALDHLRDALDEEPDKPEGANKPEGGDKPEGADKPGAGGKPESGDKPAGADKPEGAGKPEGGDKPEGKPGDSGSPQPEGSVEKSLEDELNEVELPKYSKPTTAESFAKLKEIAKRRVEEVSAKAAEYEAKLKEVSEKLEGSLSDAEKKELEDLREFRAKVDVESHASFSDFDNKIANNDKVVLAKLKEAGLPESHLKKIQELGGITNVNWEPVFKNLSPNLKLLIERKVGESEALRADKLVAIEEAKQNAGKFLSQVKTQALKRVEDTALEIASKLDHLKVPTIPKDATPEQKALLEKRIEVIKEINSKIGEWAKDDSPDSRAEFVVGTALAHLYSRQLAYTEKQLAGIDEKHQGVIKERDEKISTLEKELASVKKELDSIERASMSPRRSSAPPGKTKTPVNHFASGESALDAIRDEITAD